METSFYPVEVIPFQSVQQLLDWLADKSQISNLMSKYPPDLYQHNVCVLCQNPRVVVRSKAKPTYH